MKVMNNYELKLIKGFTLKSNFTKIKILWNKKFQYFAI